MRARHFNVNLTLHYKGNWVYLGHHIMTNIFKLSALIAVLILIGVSYLYWPEGVSKLSLEDDKTRVQNEQKIANQPLVDINAAGVLATTSELTEQKKSESVVDTTKKTNAVADTSTAPPIAKAATPAPLTALGTYTEFVTPDGYLNSEPFLLSDYIGKKVILVSFITYSCINCQRTFPYLQEWHEKYEDDGLLVVGIHTPEFSYEQDITNVQTALGDEGITFPVVLDNDRATWRAYKNRFWPRRYLIDLNGNVVFDHIGEGAYAQTEINIRRLLDI